MYQLTLPRCTVRVTCTGIVKVRLRVGRDPALFSRLYLRLFLVVAELPERVAIYPNAVWMRGYIHQSGYNLVVAPKACWALIVANGGASHCGHVVETMVARAI